jgi:hypothetical protein
MIDEKTFSLISRIAEEHSHKVFGYLKEEDLQNEIWVICLKLLESYDYSKGELEHFLRASVKNRLVNRFKDITKSVRSPCPRCEFFEPKKEPNCKAFGEDKYQCEKWKNYQLSVESRNSLLNASESTVERHNNCNSLRSLISKETREFLESKISLEYKRDLDQLTSSGKLSKQRLKKLKREISRVLYEEDLVPLKIRGKSCQM